MDLDNALTGICAKRYFAHCQLNYSGLKYHGFDKMKYYELSPRMQLGIKRLIVELHKCQRLVFSYEFEYLLFNMKKCGISLKAFFDACGFYPSFYSNKYLTDKNYSPYLFKIRLELVKIINRLLEYTLEKRQLPG